MATAKKKKTLGIKGKVLKRSGGSVKSRSTTARAKSAANPTIPISNKMKLGLQEQAKANGFTSWKQYAKAALNEAAEV